MPAPGGSSRAGAFALSPKTIGPDGPDCQVTRVFLVAHSRREAFADAASRMVWQRGGNSTSSRRPDVLLELDTSDERPATLLVASESASREQVVDPLPASYPDECIPPPPPDLDCKDIPYRNFRVLWNVPDPDPHHFDGDHDGIGCET